MNDPRPRDLFVQPQARADIQEIGDYIAQDNRAAATALIGRLEQKFQLLTQFPEMGQERSDMGKGLRHFPLGNYLILYRITPTSLEVVRVLHMAQLR